MDLTAAICFLTGLFLGSFGNVVSLRLHSHEAGIVNGRSHCPKCGYQLGFFDNIPLFSWLFLRGKCRQCRKAISWQYPATELLFGLLFLLVGLVTSADDPILLLWRLVVVFALGILVISDLRYLDIPDVISIPTIGFLVITAAANSILGVSDQIPLLSESLLGAAIIYAFFSLQIILPALSASFLHGTAKAFKDAIVSILIFPVWIGFSLLGLGKWFEKQFEDDPEEDNEVESWIGGGDMRIALIIGLTLGWKVGLVSVFVSYSIGTIFAIPLLLFNKKKLHQMVPFGPMLSLGLIIGMLWGERLLEAYLQYLRGW